MSNELQSIFSEGKTFKLANKEILIKTISVGDIPVVLTIVNKYLEVAPHLKDEKKRKAVIIKAVSEDFDSVLKILEVTTDLSKEDIKKLNLAALASISSEVIKENADFLYQHVIPAFQSTFQNLSEKQNEAKAGSTKSKS